MLFQRARRSNQESLETKPSLKRVDLVTCWRSAGNSPGHHTQTHRHTHMTCLPTWWPSGLSIFSPSPLHYRSTKTETLFFGRWEFIIFAVEHPCLGCLNFKINDIMKWKLDKWFGPNWSLPKLVKRCKTKTYNKKMKITTKLCFLFVMWQRQSSRTAEKTHQI